MAYNVPLREAQMNRREFIGASLSVSGVVGENSRKGGRGRQKTPAAVPAGENSGLLKMQPFRVYSSLLNPRQHPDYGRRHVRPPDWTLFGNHTHFTTLRSFDIKGNRIVNYAEKIKQYTLDFDLGDVLWPSYPILFATNLGDLVEEIRQGGLFLFDIWGYVPGSGPGSYWQEFHPSQDALQLLETKLKDRWLGMDNGEQDGRYIGGYASQMDPSAVSRPQQYENFRRHFERLTQELGNRMSALVSLTFGHYFLKEGLYSLIGGETAQALPNAQVLYAFIRGAGKQYGVPWFGNASVWNRWGWKEYGPPRRSGSAKGGPEKGTSLSLLKRLIYSHILYNSMTVGFESGWFETTSAEGQGVEKKLSPIGVMQRAARKWVDKEGPPGTMVAPFALMLDFFAGWTVPRHLYSSNVYRVWGNLPYGPGDHLTDAVLDMFYPGYQNSSYFHDESGFLTATPYGDGVDCILSDSPSWQLARYPLLVLAGELRGGAELKDKLEAFVEQGGTLLITAGNLKNLPGGIAGVRTSGRRKRFKPTQVEMLQDSLHTVREDTEFELYPLIAPPQSGILARCSGYAAAVTLRYGKGRVFVFSSPYALSAQPVPGTSERLEQEMANEIDKPLAKPYLLLKHSRRILDQVFQSQMLFKVGPGLSSIICRKDKGEYTLGLFNNSWQQRPFRIEARCGEVESIRELKLDSSEKSAVGYLPESMNGKGVGSNDKGHIAGGDVRVFSIRLKERNVEEIPHVPPPSRPLRRALPIRSALSIQDEVLSRPTFFQNYDRVVVDWKYFRERTPDALKKEQQWMGLQGLKLIVDLSSGIDLFPQLRLIDNISRDYQASMAAIEDVIAKMEVLKSRDLILSLHRFPENNFTKAQSWQGFTATVHDLCGKAAKGNITLHLRMSPGKPPATLKEAVSFMDRVNCSNFLLAPKVALILPGKGRFAQTLSLIRGKVGLWLLSSGARDLSGRLWNAYRSLNDSQALDSLQALLDVAPNAPVVFDAVYKNHDEEYLDVKAFNRRL